jgi:hypothetical protein
VYFIGPREGPIKVGWTSGQTEKRRGDLQVGNPAVLRVWGAIAGPKSLEQTSHSLLDRWRVRGEWFEREAALELVIDLGVHGDFEDEGEVASFVARQHARRGDPNCAICDGVGFVRGSISKKLGPPCPECVLAAPRSQALGLKP